MSVSPVVIIIGGPNGAGKSTTAPEILDAELGITEFVNADVIASGLSNFFKLYRPLATRWRMYDNALGIRRLVASGSRDQTAIVAEKAIWERLKREYA